MKLVHTKKFRYGSVSLALTVVIIAAVILLNAIVTALTGRFGLYLDMTAEKQFTLSDEAIDYLGSMDNTKEVTIILCSPEDSWEANTAQINVLETVRDIKNRFGNVKVQFVDYYTNPTAVDKYAEGYSINSQTVIVTSGGEHRVFSLQSLFVMDSSGSSIIGYNGEQRLVSAILAVTQLERPVVCVTTGHGEPAVAYNDGGIGQLLYDTGYDIQTIDLRTQDLPDDCRLVLIRDPQSDFLQTQPGMSDVSEIKKLERFLSKNNSLMVFFDKDTPVLTNLEDFMRDWGIEIARSGTANYLVREDATNSLTISGYTNVAQYVTTGIGGSMTNHLWKDIDVPKSVVFPDATAILSPYEQLWDDDNGGYFGYSDADGIERTSYDVFLSSNKAVAEAGGQEVANAALKPFSYMKLTRQTVTDDQGYTAYANVLGCASTRFASASALDPGYGNRSVLIYACKVMGQELVAVSLDPKYYVDTEINSMTAGVANQYTVVLTVIPASIIFISGIYIMVRRKYR